MKTYFESTRKKLRFQNRKTYSRSAPWDAGSKSRKDRGSYAMLPAQGVRLDLSRPIEIGRWGLDRVGEREGAGWL